MAVAEAQYGLSKEAVFGSLNYEPHKGQREIHGNGCRHRVADCGRRFGKSVVGGNELVPEALLTFTLRNELEDAGVRREFWIVGPEYTDSEKEFRVLYNQLKRLKVPFDHPGTYNNPESGDMVVSLWGGLYLVHAKSAKYPGTLVGEGLNGVILAEAAKLKEIVWTKFLRPTLADWRGWSLHTSTPEGKNWFYRSWQRGQDPKQRNWASWKFPSWVNDYVFPKGASREGLAMLRDAMQTNALDYKLIKQSGVDEEIVDMMLEMTEERFAQEVGAEFTEFVGRVFKEFDEEVHVRDLAYDPRYPVYGACDYGWTNPFVFLVIQVDVFDNVYVLAEYRTKNTDINDIARDLSQFPIIREKINTFYPDPEDPGSSAVLSKYLRMKTGGSTGGELKWRLELIRQWLKQVPATAPPDKRQPRLLIDRSCNGMPLGDGGLVREMQDYRYPETKAEQLKEAPENPLKKDDHGPEALGRFFRGHFGGPPTGGNARPKVRKANLASAKR